jgi:tRNA threonylcarbamoyladenosine biosynthesis protein TsaB
MLLLAFDTSTRQASITLCSESAVLSEYTWFAGNNHSVDLLDHLQRMIAEQQITLQQLSAVAVALGPGSFNGVRVALATAKALAFSLQKPLVGISTLEIIAAQQRHWHGPVCALVEAGRSELYAAFYRFDEHISADGSVSYQSKHLSEYLLFSPEQLAIYLQEHESTWFVTDDKQEKPRILFCGEISAISQQALLQYLPGQCLFMNALQSTRHASVLAQLALQRVHDGLEDDPLTLEPLYVRRPSITTSTRKQPLLRGTVQRQSGQDTTEREEGAIHH